MITISKTLEAQEKTQDIKQNPSTKMETKPDARSRRNELDRGDRTWPYEDRTRLISCSAIAGVSSSDRMLSEAVTGRTDFIVHRQRHDDRTTGCDDRTTRHTKKQRPIMSIKVLERRQHNWTHPIE